MTKKIAAVWFLVGVAVGAVAIGAYGAGAQSGAPMGTWQVVTANTGSVPAAWRINTTTGELAVCFAGTIRTCIPMAK